MTASSPTPTLIGVSVLAQACVVCCHGPLERDVVTDLREALHNATQRSSTVVLHAQDVVRISNAGLAVLVGTSRLLQARGGTLRLAAASPGVTRALAFTGLRTRLTVDAAAPDGWVDPCLALAGAVPDQRQP